MSAVTTPQQADCGFRSLGIGDVEDLSKICRICGKIPNKPVYSVFGSQCLKMLTAEKMHKHLNIEINETDPPPRGICEYCLNILISWDKLVSRCAQIQEILHQWNPNHTADNGTGLGQSYSIQIEQTKSEMDDDYNNLIPNMDGLWTPDSNGSDRYEVSENENDLKYNPKLPLKTHGDTIASDDEPLANVATRKTIDSYHIFYTALKNFRDHLVNDHDGQSNCSDFSDSTESGEENIGNMDFNGFDDLTENNMRKDKMDEETRIELGEVQTKINGKVFFTCKICGKNLSSSHTYIFHKRIHTGERPCVCHVCGKQFRAPNGLQRHLTETHLKQRRYNCIMCHKNFANSQNLKQHMRIHTGERPYVCSHCGKRFTQSGSLHVHLKTHTEQFPHPCADCGSKFRLRSSLKRHRLKHTGERPHVCVHCGKGFRQKHELNGHILTHTDSKPHACSTCGVAFRQRRALRHHCKRLHDNDCADASFMVYNNVTHYDTLNDLKMKVKVEAEHEMKMDNEVKKNPIEHKENIEKPQTVVIEDGKKYGVCDICKKKVLTASWKRHLRSHQTTKRFRCHSCGLGFSDSGNLVRHTRALHTDYRPFACHVCHKTFSRKGHLQDHVRSHSDDREYVCDTCGKASKSSAALRMHRKIHENGYRFQCLYCNSKFKRRGQLNAHISVHTGEKAHACVCGKTFRLKSQLTIHARLHDRVKL